jgi:hypothetical protein
MLGPFLLPAGITLVVMLGILFAVRAIAKRYDFNRRIAMGLAALLGWLAFFPACGGVYTLIYPWRYGVFQYETSDDVHDWRVSRFLPDGAKSLTIDKMPTGFRAKFFMESQAFHQWFDRHWQEYGERSVISREEAMHAAADSAPFGDEFAGLGWVIPEDVQAFEGPRARNGAGFTIWYSERDGVGYVDAGYW